MVKAACLLHDVSWRAHPDYRAEVTFDNATRANLGGLKHSERVMMGLALSTRYSNKRPARYEPLYALIDDAQAREADILGRAMRFGAMLWLDADRIPGKFKWNSKKRTLALRLDNAARPLFGEVAQSRLKSLANVLDAELTVTFRDHQSGGFQQTHVVRDC